MEVFCKKGILRISEHSQENTCARVSFLIKLQALDLQLYYKETLRLVFSCEFCEISMNAIFFVTEHLWWLLLNIVTTTNWHTLKGVKVLKLIIIEF